MEVGKSLIDRLSAGEGTSQVLHAQEADGAPLRSRLNV